MDGDPAARSSADAGKKQRVESGRQRTLDSYTVDCPPELVYAKDASAQVSMAMGGGAILGKNAPPKPKVRQNVLAGTSTHRHGYLCWSPFLQDGQLPYQRSKSIAELVRSKEVQVQAGLFNGFFAANLLDNKYPAPATMESVDPGDEALYNQLLRDCVTFRPPPVDAEQSPTDAEVLLYPWKAYYPNYLNLKPFKMKPQGQFQPKPCKFKPEGQFQPKPWEFQPEGQFQPKPWEF
jgi:hypothetical protein